MNFHNLKISSLNKLTADSIEIVFELPAELKSEFRFKPGQHITLDINGEQRQYSLSGSPLDDQLSIAVRMGTTGYFSNLLKNSEIKEGQFIRVGTPKGDLFLPENKGKERVITAFAGGSGITPIMSMLRYNLETEKDVKFYLFYSNRAPKNVMFFDELNELKKKYPDNFFPHYFYSRHKLEDWLHEGRLDAAKFKLIMNHLVDIRKIDEAVVCGPMEMVKAITTELFTAGVPKDQIHFEMFGTDVNHLDLLEPIPNIPDNVEVTAKLNGDTHKFIWKKDSNLEDAIIDAGIELPYTWNDGVLTACACKLEEGEVYMLDNCVLDHKHSEEGLILACVARPKSEKITINLGE